MLKDKETVLSKICLFSDVSSITPLTSNVYFCDFQKPPVTVKVGELTMN